MITFSVDASFNAVSMTFFDDGRVIYDLFADSEQTHSKALVGLMDCALRAVPLTLDDIDELYCCVGPGNYTSLRVLIATVKGLFFQKNVNVHTVNTFDLMAAGFHDKSSEFTVVSPAFAHQVKCINYAYTDGAAERSSDIYIKKEFEIADSGSVKISPIESYYASKVLPLSKNVRKIRDKFIKDAELKLLSPVY